MYMNLIKIKEYLLTQQPLHIGVHRGGRGLGGGGGGVHLIPFGIFVDHVIIFSSRFKPYATSKMELFETKKLQKLETVID